MSVEQADSISCYLSITVSEESRFLPLGDFQQSIAFTSHRRMIYWGTYKQEETSSEKFPLLNRRQTSRSAGQPFPITSPLPFCIILQTTISIPFRLSHHAAPTRLDR